MRPPAPPTSRGRPTVAISVVAAVITVLSTGCGDGGTSPPPPDSPASLAIVSGDNQSGNVGSLLVRPFVVRVRNAADAPLSAITVDWTVVAGAGTLGSATSTSNAQGDAQVAYALGPNAGANQVKATVQGSTLSATFTATGTALPPDVTPATINLASGNNQSATVGTALPLPLVVDVRNAGGETLSGIAVVWTVASGGGSLGQATTTTTLDGEASNTYTVGASAGANTVKAAVQGKPAITVTFNATATANLTPAVIEIVSGNNQSATVSTALAQPLVSRVKNALNQILTGVTIAWTVPAGGGTLGSATSVTDAQGQASNTYTVGASAGTNTIQAAVQSNPAINVSFTATATALANTASVSVGNNLFSPSNATLATGGTVTWTWAAGAFTHNITWVAGGFANSGDKSSGTHQVTFPASGTFQYYCSIHGTPTTGMRGTVTVP